MDFYTSPHVIYIHIYIRFIYLYYVSGIELQSMCVFMCRYQHFFKLYTEFIILLCIKIRLETGNLARSQEELFSNLSYYSYTVPVGFRLYLFYFNCYLYWENAHSACYNMVLRRYCSSVITIIYISLLLYVSIVYLCCIYKILCTYTSCRVITGVINIKYCTCLSVRPVSNYLNSSMYIVSTLKFLLINLGVN